MHLEGREEHEESFHTSWFSVRRYNDHAYSTSQPGQTARTSSSQEARQVFKVVRRPRHDRLAQSESRRARGRRGCTNSGTVVHVSDRQAYPARPVTPVVGTDPSSSRASGPGPCRPAYLGPVATPDTNFSLEPPDQALCVDDGRIIEGVDTAFQIYNENGGADRAQSHRTTVFGLHAAINRTPGRSQRSHE